MDEKANEQDKKIQDDHDKLKEENNKVSSFSKLLAYNSPKAYVFIGVFMAILTGTYQPISGIILSELLAVMTLPFEVL